MQYLRFYNVTILRISYLWKVSIGSKGLTGGCNGLINRQNSMLHITDWETSSFSENISTRIQCRGLSLLSRRVNSPYFATAQHIHTHTIAKINKKNYWYMQWHEFIPKHYPESKRPDIFLNFIDKMFQKRKK